MEDEYEPEEWSVKITKVANGVIVEKDSNASEVWETEDDYGPKRDNVVGAVYSILSHLDLIGDKFSEQRIYVRVGHGSKVDCTDENCWVCNS